MNTIESLHDLKIQHAKWKKALIEAFAVLSMSSPGDVVCIVGPPRVGKTRLILELCGLLGGDSNFEETGLMPVIVVEAANTGPNGRFSTKGFTHLMLEAVKHPFLTHEDDEFGTKSIADFRARITESEMQRALVKSLIHRKVQYLIVDEVQHIKYVSGNTVSAHGVADALKSLAQRTGVVLVLVGTYPIVNIIRESPHLVSRKHQIHFTRYYDTCLDDMREFASIIKCYEKKMVLDDSLRSLTDHVELLYEGTLGCIGLLRAWLMRSMAMSRAYERGVTLAIIKDTMLSLDDRKVIASEILAGENLLKKGEVEDTVKQVKETVKAAIRKANKKPFKRRPVRHAKGNRAKKDVDLDSGVNA